MYSIIVPSFSEKAACLLVPCLRFSRMYSRRFVNGLAIRGEL